MSSAVNILDALRQINGLERHLADANAKVAELEGKNTALRVSHVQYINLLASTEAKVAELEAERDALRQKLSRSAVDDLARANDELRAKVEELGGFASVACPENPGDPCEVCGATIKGGTCLAGNPAALRLQGKVAALEEFVELASITPALDAPLLRARARALLGEEGPDGK